MLRLYQWRMNYRDYISHIPLVFSFYRLCFSPSACSHIFWTKRKKDISIVTFQFLINEVNFQPPLAQSSKISLLPPYFLTILHLPPNTPTYFPFPFPSCSLSPLLPPPPLIHPHYTSPYPLPYRPYPFLLLFQFPTPSFPSSHSPS